MAYSDPSRGPDTVAFPLRIGVDGRLVRGDRREAVLHLFKAMAGTPSRTWPHAPWFGLHEAFLGANTALEDQPRLADLLNDGLKALGITWARVESVTTARGESAADAVGAARGFNITLALEDGEFFHGGVSLTATPT